MTVAFKCKKERKQESKKEREKESKKEREGERKKESMVLSNNALYNAYTVDADYHLFMISDIKPTMEDKNPWNGYGKPSFHILNLSNVQM